MSESVTWRYVGRGKRLHAFVGNSIFSLCKCRLFERAEQIPLFLDKCEACQTILARSKEHNER